MPRPNRLAFRRKAVPSLLGAALLAFGQPALARTAGDWGSSGWMDTNSSGNVARPQPTFERQWWETDAPAGSGARSQSPATNCRDVADRANAIRQNLGRDLDDYAHCLASGSKAPDDCARPFDRVKSGQYEYERAVREFGDRCR